jgi:hypothetical protein
VIESSAQTPHKRSLSDLAGVDDHFESCRKKPLHINTICQDIATRAISE